MMFMLYPFIGPMSSEDILNGKVIDAGVTGCYVIRNEKSGKTYVGQGADVMKRVKSHLTGRGGNPDVYFDYRTAVENGHSDEFSVYFVSLADTQFKELSQLESSLMLLFESVMCGYNAEVSDRVFTPMMRVGGSFEKKKRGDDFHVEADTNGADQVSGQDVQHYWTFSHISRSEKYYCEYERSSKMKYHENDIPKFWVKEFPGKAEIIEQNGWNHSVRVWHYDDVFEAGCAPCDCNVYDESGNDVSDQIEEEWQFFEKPTVYDVAKAFVDYFDHVLSYYRQALHLVPADPFWKSRAVTYPEYTDTEYDFRNTLFEGMTFEDAYVALLKCYTSFFDYVNERSDLSADVVPCPGYLPEGVYAALLEIFFKRDLRLLVPCRIIGSPDDGYGKGKWVYDAKPDIWRSVISLWDTEKKKYSTAALRKLIKTFIRKADFQDNACFDVYTENVVSFLWERFIDTADEIRYRNVSCLYNLVCIDQLCIFVFVNENYIFDRYILTASEKNRMNSYNIHFKKCINEIHLYQKHLGEMKDLYLSGEHDLDRHFEEDWVETAPCNQVRRESDFLYDLTFADVKNSYLIDFLDAWVDELYYQSCDTRDQNDPVDIPLNMIRSLVNMKCDAKKENPERYFTTIFHAMFLWAQMHPREWKFYSEPASYHWEKNRNEDNTKVHLSVGSLAGQVDWLDKESEWCCEEEKDIAHDHWIYGLKKIK